MMTFIYRDVRFQLLYVSFMTYIIMWKHWKHPYSEIDIKHTIQKIQIDFFFSTRGIFLWATFILIIDIVPRGERLI